jgi:hypothetical protein
VKIAVDDAFSGGDPTRNSPYPVLSLVPFVAVVRRILIATAQVEQWLVAGREISPLLYELGALAGLVLSLAIALSLARKHSGRGSDYEAD